jgi:hypothetical protein
VRWMVRTAEKSTVTQNKPQVKLRRARVSASRANPKSTNTSTANGAT